MNDEPDVVDLIRCTLRAHGFDHVTRRAGHREQCAGRVDLQPQQPHRRARSRHFQIERSPATWMFCDLSAAPVSETDAPPAFAITGIGT